jgi:hypothetical protein
MFCIKIKLCTFNRQLQGVQKVSVHLMITIQKVVTSNVQSVLRQSQERHLLSPILTALSR